MRRKLRKIAAFALLLFLLVTAFLPREEAFDLSADRIRRDTHYLCEEIGIRVTGTEQERKAYRKELLPRIQECFREAGSLSGQTKVFLSLYRYLPRLYQLLICAKVKARSRMA